MGRRLKDTSRVRRRYIASSLGTLYHRPNAYLGGDKFNECPIFVKSNGAALATTVCTLELSRLIGSGSSGFSSPRVANKLIKCPPEDPHSSNSVGVDTIFFCVVSDVPHCSLNIE